jgi:hypothetical protein
MLQSSIIAPCPPLGGYRGKGVSGNGSGSGSIAAAWCFFFFPSGLSVIARRAATFGSKLKFLGKALLRDPISVALAELGNKISEDWNLVFSAPKPP